MSQGQQIWKLDELAEKSREFLDQEGDSNRIQWKPNGRQIRYYTTLGLLDKPFGGRGQGATYGPKHLLQLIAIKRLQHQGLKLADIQQILTGQSKQKLAELLGYSAEWLEELETPTEEPEPQRRDSDFWSVIPEPPVRHTPVSAFYHFDLAPGATFMASESAVEHLDDNKKQHLADELRKVWQQFQEEE